MAMGGIGADQLRSRMVDLGIGTAHNTLANEGEGEGEDNTTGASSSNQDVAMNLDEQNRNVQISQLTSMLRAQQMKVVSGATPMNTQGAEDQAYQQAQAQQR